jgi:predicted metal-dependent hydrolase
LSRDSLAVPEGSIEVPMTQTLTLPGDPPLVVALRRSARARRISLRVSRLDGGVTLTLPEGASSALGERFLHERAAWLRAAVAGIDAPMPVVEGAALPVEGRALMLERGAVSRVTVAGDRLMLPPRGRAGALAAGWLKLLARERAVAAVTRHAAALGQAALRPPARLRLADPGGRWGSCSSAGDIMLSWRLVLAPPEVLDYVAAHEVAHLAQMNHSPAFWATVAALVPDYAPRRTWLQRHGATLHLWRFEAAA